MVTIAASFTPRTLPLTAKSIFKESPPEKYVLVAWTRVTRKIPDREGSRKGV